MKQYSKYILPYLCIMFCGIAFVMEWNHHEMPTKDEFYAKHHIENDTLMPSYFNEAEYQKAFMEIFHKRYKDNAKLVQDQVGYFISFLKQIMVPPEQYEGFYTPRAKVRFYNALYKDNLPKLGLSLQDIKDLDLIVTDEMVHKWHMGMTIQQLEKEGFYTIADTAQLVAKVGDNIYLTGFYTDCGTSGCSVNIMVKEQEKWYSKKSDILFGLCMVDKYKAMYECDLIGGNNDFGHYAADYAPLKELTDKYYEVWDDYIYTYLQRKNRKDE